MVEITASHEEIKNATLSAAHTEEALRAIRADGFVVLRGVVDVAHVDMLCEKMLHDVEELIRRPDAPYNWNSGNVQQDPPPFPPYLFADVLLNPQVIAVTNALLGPGLTNTMYSGNTAMPSESRQPVHADFTHLWPRIDVAHPPAQVVVNVPTVDMGPENGSTEIWPGTHLDVTARAGRDIKIPANELEARRPKVPPLQPSVMRGSVLIRDGRMWHAGMPNRTSRPRPMIAMMHSCAWLRPGEPLQFSADSEEMFAHPVLRTHARFVKGPIDYLNAPKSYEYTPQSNSGKG